MTKNRETHDRTVRVGRSAKVCLIEVSLYMIHVGTYMERRGDPLIIMYTWSGEKGVYGRGYID